MPILFQSASQFHLLKAQKAEWYSRQRVHELLELCTENLTLTCAHTFTHTPARVCTKCHVGRSSIVYVKGIHALTWAYTCQGGRNRCSPNPSMVQLNFSAISENRIYGNVEDLFSDCTRINTLVQTRRGRDSVTRGKRKEVGLEKRRR